jgi:AraC-like DNA-binding protein
VTRDADALSEVLLRLSVNSTVFCFFMSSPWGFKVPAREVPAFHILTSGAAWLEVDGLAQPLRLTAGDLVILPRGQAHIVRNSARTTSLESLERILVRVPAVNAQRAYGGGGEDRSELLCGGFAIDPIAGRAVLDALPDIVHLKGGEALAPEWLVGLVRMIGTEVAKGGPGSEAVVTRLTDALLAHALRHSLEEAARATDAAEAYGDRQIARALRSMRDHPDQDWTVPKLAASVAMSRSAFAERFRAAMGESPMRHLTRYRMARAAEYLRLTDAGLREIARLTGYDSEVSVTKAFRREFGLAPGAYRKANARS